MKNCLENIGNSVVPLYQTAVFQIAILKFVVCFVFVKVAECGGSFDFSV